MAVRPVVLGLSICDRVIVEEGTKNITLVNCFTKLLVDSFPSPPQRFALFAAFIDGLGDATIEVVATHLDTDRIVYRRQIDIRFPDKLVEVRMLYRVTHCVFPVAGKYQFTLVLDREWLAQRDVQVLAKEKAS